MSTTLQNQKRLAETFLQEETTWDDDAVIDCLHQLLPQTLGHPIRNNRETKDFYDQLKTIWTDYKVHSC